MSVTVDLDESRDVRMTDVVIETKPPGRIAFAAEGTITTTEELLDRFEETSLKPVRIGISVDGSEPVGIDLGGEASLRLDTVDVGVETPDTDDLSAGVDTVRSSSNGDSESTDTGAIAFTVEGAIRSVPEETFESLADGSPTLRSITFAVEEAVRNDGGSGTDVLLEISVLGYDVVVRRNGTIEIGTG